MRDTRPLAAIESDLIAITDPQRHAELRAELAAAGLPHLAAELDRIAAGPVVDSPATREQVTAALVDLLNRSGYTRLEIVRAGNGFSGYCIDADRHGFHIGRAAELAATHGTERN
jgi:hypothetical protein